MYEIDRVSSIEEMKGYDREFWHDYNLRLINIKFRPLSYSITDEDLDNIVKQIYNSKGNILLIGASNAELIRDIIIPVSKLLKIDLPIIKYDEVDILGKRVILLPTNHKDEFAIKGTNFSLVISLDIDCLNEDIFYEALRRMRSSDSKLFILSTTSNRKLIQLIEDKLNEDEVNYSHVILTQPYTNYDCDISDTIDALIDSFYEKYGILFDN